jgi:ABC-2 type transport system permease protein
VKELIQLRRDRVTFATMIFIPLVQLMLFGYAINTDPKHLPTAVLIQDDSVFTRSFMAALRTSEYFDVRTVAQGEADLDHLILSGVVQFGVQIPANFGRDLIRGEKPSMLVVADATDPVATGTAIGALQGPVEQRLRPRSDRAGGEPRAEGAALRNPCPPTIQPDRCDPAEHRAGAHGHNPDPHHADLHRSLGHPREESLLSMPIRPVEIMLGKIAPYVMVGAMQMTLILVAANLLFDVPIVGDLGLLVGLTMLFIVANLSVGYTFSTIATNQLQAIQMSFFFFLPNILLSGFMFPFRGMPAWAQYFCEMLPLTHYLRIVRGVMLKGAGFEDLQTDVFAMAAFTVAAMGLAVARFRQTLDQRECGRGYDGHSSLLRKETQQSAKDWSAGTRGVPRNETRGSAPI